MSRWEKGIVVYYEGQEDDRHRLDMFVENKLVVELKTVEALSFAHYAKVRSYMKGDQCRHSDHLFKRES